MLMNTADLSKEKRKQRNSKTNTDCRQGHSLTVRDGSEQVDGWTNTYRATITAVDWTTTTAGLWIL